ncbi:uncharacterized protein LOC120914215 isoform X1 [Rana temporaria]|uniref:uncharacterized protein LOC120914215 isoform X1 n=1 Tax=Rana temporaria TaxID=8407 RepID=UPI001AACD420|nr:uncharacterized protein LOC120914215 isoform X1 [Rana temporaria]
MGVRHVLLLFCMGLVMGDPYGCMKVNPCKCLMKDGSGVINLSALGDMEGFLIRDKKVERQVNGTRLYQTVTFSPCLPFSEPMALVNCSRVAVCVVTRGSQTKGSVPQYVGYGHHEGNEFSYSNESKILTVAYKGSPFRTIVHFNCSSTKSVTFPAILDSSEILEITVHSPCVCPSSCQAEDVGPGNIILIMFAVSLIAYLVFGARSLHSMQNLEGSQVSPEPRIWFSVCCPIRKKPEETKLADSYSDLDTTEYFKV